MSGMSLTFGAPWLLAGLVIPLAALVALAYATRRRRAASEVLGGPPGLRVPRSQRLRTVIGLLVVTSAVLAVVAAARPQWGEDDQALTQRGIDVIVALDVSRSMEAEDVPPSRARAAAAGLAEMLTHMTGNRVGLVVFAGDAFARAPLTVDLPVVSSLITRAQVEAPLVEPGTNFRGALAEAFRLLDVEDAARTQAVLLVSDGEDLSADATSEDGEGGFQEAIDFAERRGIRIYTVFAGTSNPTALPEDSGGTDVSVAQPEVLDAIAEQTGASFRTSERIPGLAVEFRRLQQTQFGEGEQREPVERYAWFAGGAAGLLLLVAMLGEGAATRLPRLRGGVISAALAVLVGLVVAGCGTAAWQHVRAGNDAYDADRFEEALAEYRQAAESVPQDAAVNYNIANALHELGRVEEAIASAEQARVFAEEAGEGATSALALYTLGNTHFRATDLVAARDAYQAALRIDPRDQDAKANLELVLRLMAPTEPPEAPPPDPGSGDDGEGEGNPQDGGGEPGEGTAEGEGDPSDQPGQGEEPAGSPGEQPGSPGTGTGGEGGAPSGEGITTLEEAQSALEQALGELGPEVTLEEAMRILELSRRANELNPLPSSSGGGVPPR